MSIRKSTFKGAAKFATVTAFAAAFFVAPNTYAATSVTVGGEDITTDSGTKSNSANTVTYDAGESTLTLNNYSGGAIKTSGINDLAIKLSGNNTITADSDKGLTTGGAFMISGSGTLTINSGSTCIDTGSLFTLYGTAFSLKDATLKLNCAYSGVSANTAHVYSGKIDYVNTSNSTTNGVMLYTYNTTTIDSGTFTSSAAIARTILQQGDIIINGGTFTTNNTNSLESSFLSSWGNMTINGGTLTANHARIDVYSPSSLTINGGTINLSNVATAIDSYDTTINGGRITINATYEGISQLSNSDTGITFNGGYTKINVSGIGSTLSARGSKGIVLGDDMRILESDVVIGKSGNYAKTLVSGTTSNAKVTTICPTDDSDCSEGSTVTPTSNTDTTTPVDSTTPAGTNTDDEDSDSAATLASATIDNPDTADHFWLYGLIAAGITSVFVALRRYFIKH